MNKKLKTVLAELRHQLESLYGPRLVRLILYGSQARGDAEPGSDIDVLVVLEGPVNPGEEIERTGKIVAGLSLEYNEVIACVFVSSDQFEHEQSPLLINVRREGETFGPLSPAMTVSVLMDHPIQETRKTYLATPEMTGSHLKEYALLERHPLMIPEQSALLRKAMDSLKAAKLLVGQGFSDFAASRAYYAMFYVASAFLLGEGLSFSKHSTVVAKFGQHFAKTGRVPAEFHHYLIEGMEARHIGDYGIKPIDKAKATVQITHAEQFLELAERFLGPVSPADTNEI